ncbi:hypothetical protein [Vallicoccus soli]|uniref:Uncharacterized protein n=1 Tax=Vallicoccus soli TaxID=2339232 RepID=A0A3A3Z2F1_9ACTN|nr:hypothetical protein [Vallicoccus soli]RJK97614.1 hypothetical protein D5H78_00860 [Vallicoccus soli]
MTTTARGALRALRCLVAAGTTTALGVLAHVLASGHPPDALAALLSAALVAALWWPATRRPVGAAEVLALLALGQVAVHVLLHAAGAAGHAHGALPAADPVLPPDAMGLAHVVATLAAAVVLRAGERAAAALLELLRPLVRLLVARALPARAPLARPAARPVPLRPRLLVLDAARRGPPAHRRAVAAAAVR